MTYNTAKQGPTHTHTHAPHELHVDGGEVHGRLAAVLVYVGDVLGQTQVGIGIRLVLDEPEQVKT